MKRDTTLTAEVQWTLGFIPIKTVPRLHPTVNEKSQRWHTQQAETSIPQKAAAVCFTNTYLGTNSVIGSFKIPFVIQESFF